MKGRSLTCTRLQVAVRVMGYYNSVPLTEAMQTTSLLVVMISLELSGCRYGSLPF